MKYLIKSLPFLFFGCSFAQAQEVTVEDARDHLSDTAAYISEKRSKLTISPNGIDIFGRPQNLQKAKLANSNRGTNTVTPAAPKREIPFQNIVDELPITLMNPVDDLVILEGAGAIRAGQIVEFPYDGKPVQLRFEGVRAKGAYFRDLESRKLVLRSNKRLGEGIKAGNKRSTAKGIRELATDRAAPIPIQLNLSPSRPN